MAAKVFPVIHIRNDNIHKAARQAEVAFGAEADGVYLIDHENAEPDVVVRAFNVIKFKNPGQFVGINFLQFLHGYDAFRYVRRAAQQELLHAYPDSIWIDDAAPRHDELDDYRQRVEILQNVQYLGGIAFKYTDGYTAEPQEAAAQAEVLQNYVDVVTTSGPGTGRPPALEKILAMRRAIGSKPLAIASGLSVENLSLYKDVADIFLVASSIETSQYSGVFDKTVINKFISLAHR